jgi:signal transduction histidine kinase
MQPLPPAGVWVSLVTAAVLTYVNPVPPQGLRSEFRWFEGLRRPSTTSVDLAGLEAGRLRSAYETKIQETARQEERHRLARELHDAVKQQLFVIQTAAATAQVRLTADSAGARDALDQVRASARDSIAELEAMLDQLQATPLEQTGLVDTLRKQGDALELRTGVRVRFELGALPPGDTLAPGAGLAVLRVAQEALSNVGRHARASAVTIRYGWTDHRLELCVSDDGAGFDTTATTTGIGTRSMQARAAEFGGTLALTSAPGAGTQVTLSVPCDPLPALARSFRVQAVIWGCFVVGWFALFVAAMAQGDPVRNGYFWVWIVFPLLNFAAYLGAYHRSRRRQRALAR